VHAELKAQGVAVGKKRVALLMRAAGGREPAPRRGHHAAGRSDAVERDFTATGPDQLWMADTTDIATWTGFLSLAIVLDVRSRRVVG
jgi:putative transposase